MNSLLLDTYQSSNAYNNILNCLEQDNKVINLKQYLQELQPYVKDLRQTYKSNLVKANYFAPKAQAAYLLAYYPHYVQMTYKVLENLAANNVTLPFEELDKLQACFFGAGPAPEFLGWINYLRTNHRNTNNVEAYTYDIAATGWATTRKTTVRLVSRGWLNRKFGLNASSLNLCQKNAFYPLKLTIQKCCLFVVQNCLNEIASNPGNFVENINFLVDTMPSNSIFIMADLNYDSIVRLMNETEVCLKNNSQAIIARSHTKGVLRFRSSIPIPAFIIENLLNSSERLLVPKSWTKFNYLAIQRNNVLLN